MRRDAGPRRPGPPPALLLAGLPGARLPARLAERAGRREQALRQDTPAAGRAPIDAPGETGPQEAGTGREADGRDALSLDRIVRAALEIADREGLEALSMRRVAAALGAGTMSLYRHVSARTTWST